MSGRARTGAFALALAAALSPPPSRASDVEAVRAGPPPAASAPAAADAVGNAAVVRAAFDAWRDGDGSVFDLLADDVEWTVAGGSPVSGTYRSKRAFLAEAVAPITARLSTPIRPEVSAIVAQGDAVVVFWEGTAAANDGSPYRNSYAWHMVLSGGRVVRVTAFLDTWALDALMR